jgi:hypothetical protein
MEEGRDTGGGGQWFLGGGSRLPGSVDEQRAQVWMKKERISPCEGCSIDNLRTMSEETGQKPRGGVCIGSIPVGGGGK